MSRIILALLVLVAVATALPQSLHIPSHCDYLTEEYSACAYTIEPTCELPTLEAFRTTCSPGCQCKPGLVRNYIGQCISPIFCGTSGFPYSKSKD